MAMFVRKCPCLRPQIEEEVRLLDYRHCSLTDVPGEVFNFERTLEELLVDSNQIQDLPRELFYCHGIRRLSLSDNEIKQIPAAIGSLISLEHLDLSKNGVIDIPENIKCCKYLQSVDASVNPLGKLPDGFTQLLNLTQLYLNDTFLDYLPGNFGRLSKLKILEIRENHLKTLPKSFSRLTELEKLDIGHNEFTELPDVVGSLCNLLELWCDHNQIQTITPTIGNLKQLMFFDGCNNNLQSLPPEIEGCSSLADLHLTSNQLQSLPDSIGNLGNLTTLKADDNHLTSIPNSIGGLTSLSELNVSCNDLEELPSSLGLLRYLRTLYADENELEFIPAELGSCNGITVLSLRGNKLTYIPDELGRIPRLRVLNLSANQLKCLPFTIVKLKELQALWLSENQTRPLVQLQSDHDPDNGRKILTCYLLPQRPPQETGDGGGDTDSFHASMWEEERRNRQQIHFAFGDDSDVDGNFIRQPTPYPKEMREKARHLKNVAVRQQITDPRSHDPRSQGQDNLAYDQRWQKHASPSIEKLSLNNNDEIDRMHTRDGRKPGSPSLHDPYSLYKYDKEKLAKDKARMQQRANQEEESRSLRTPSSPTSSERSSKKGKDRKSKIQDADDGGFGEARVSSLGSTPDLPSVVHSCPTRNRFTYCSPLELSQNILSRSSASARSHHSHNQNHRSRRHNRMREYDSDTGYRSDQELIRFRQQQQQMYLRQDNDTYSEIIPVTKKGRRREGYSSDVEGYTHRGAATMTYHETPVTSHKVYTDNDVKLIGKEPSGLTPSKSQTSITVGNDELYEQRGVETGLRHPPGPSPFDRRKPLDQSSPVTPQSGRRRSTASDWRQEGGVETQRSEVIHDPQNRYMMGPSEDVPRATPPYKSAPPYNLGPQGQRKLPPTPNRTSPYGVSMFDRQARSTPNKNDQFNPHRMSDISELRDTSGEINVKLMRSRSQPEYSPATTDLPHSHSHPHPYQSNGDTQGSFYERQFHSGSESPRTPSSNSANVSKSSQGQMPGDVTSSSSKDSGNYSYRDHTGIGESPLHFRQSPLHPADGHGSRSSPLDPTHCRLDHYNRYGEPPTVDIPSRYDDIAMYKSAEPPSQVSSSTDSGYGHGHNLFDKMLDSHKFSTDVSQGSPSPDQLTSDSTATSTSSQGQGHQQYSRGATPVNHRDSQSREATLESRSREERFRVTITKNPGLGFSIAGGKGAYGNPFRPGDMGIFVTKVQSEGPAAPFLKPGDKLLEVNGQNFEDIDHKHAVGILKSTGQSVQLFVGREIIS